MAAGIFQISEEIYYEDNKNRAEKTHFTGSRFWLHFVSGSFLGISSISNGINRFLVGQRETILQLEEDRFPVRQAYTLYNDSGSIK